MFNIRCLKNKDRFVEGDMYIGWQGQSQNHTGDVWYVTLFTTQRGLDKDYSSVITTTVPDNIFEIVSEIDMTLYKLVCVKDIHGGRVSIGGSCTGYKVMVEYHTGYEVESRLSWFINNVSGGLLAADLDSFVTIDEYRNNIINELI